MKTNNIFCKKIILVLLVMQIFACGVLFAMAKNQSIIGQVKVYGNEPHTYLGLKTEEGTVFTLKADKETLDDTNPACCDYNKVCIEESIKWLKHILKL
jgi:hypothetical protein